jgi:hypothetical protein
METTREALRSIAKTLPALPRDTVESMLVMFEILVYFGDREQRPEAALFLRDAAARCGAPSKRSRLLRAADSVIASEPIARAPERRIWR